MMHLSEVTLRPVRWLWARRPHPRWFRVFCVIGALSYFALAAATWYSSHDSAATSRDAAATGRAVARGNAAASCRSQFAGRVTDARTDLEDTAQALSDQGQALNQALGRGLQAAVAEDQVAYLRASLDLDRANDRVTELRRLVSRERAVVRRANQTYQAVLAADRADQPLFRRMCAARKGITPTKIKPFTSCAAAREAGATPLRRGDPDYSPALDSDGDGVACE